MTQCNPEWETANDNSWLDNFLYECEEMSKTHSIRDIVICTLGIGMGRSMRVFREEHKNDRD